MSHSIGMFLILILVCAQLGLLGFNFVTYYFREFGTFMAITPSEKTIKLTPSLRPAVSAKALLSWATLAATATLTIDFVNTEQNLNNLKHYFTTDGYENFLAAMAADNVIETIKSKKLVLTAVPIGPAIILNEDEVNGFHQWTIQVPITVSYISSSAEEKGNKVVTVVISQVSTESANTGIGIIRYEAADVSSDVLRDLV